MRRPQLSKGTDLRRIGARLRRAFSGTVREQERLHVLSPLSVPLPGSAGAREINKRLYQWLVRKTVSGLGMRGDPLLWVYTPTVAPYLDGIPRSGLVYHCVDRWWAFSDYDSDVMRACHASLCRSADIVFASSAALVEDCLEFTPRVHLVRHGVEWHHFAQAALEPQQRPGDIADVRGPILGFFGLIHEWIDQELLCRIADAFPEATVVLIGKEQVDTTLLRSRRNIRMLGQKPYADLPAYSAHFDVALIPFAYDDLTVAVNPIKLREYLSAGLPVVATGLPEIELLTDNPWLRTGRSAEEHIAGIRHYLSSNRDPGERRNAALTMISESWLGRCAEMAGLVEQRRKSTGSARRRA